MAAGAQDPGDLGRPPGWRRARRRGRSGRRGRGASAAPPTLKATRPSGSRPTRAVAARIARVGAVDAAHPRARELAGEEERAVAVAALRPRAPAPASPTSSTAAASGVSGGGVDIALDRKAIASRLPRRWRRRPTDAGSSSAFSPLVAVGVVAAILISRGGGDERRRRYDERRPATTSGCKQVEAPEPKKVTLHGAGADRRSRAKKLTAVVQTSCGTFDDRPRHRAGAENRQLLRLPRRRRLLRRPHLPPDRPRNS